jgi:DNA-cytosine methyltransferase
MIKYGELFSGIGVGSLAFKEVFGTDAKCEFFSEIHPQRVKAYLKNFPDHKNVGNIDFVDIDRLPKIDVLIGGSPCQDLSIARGKGREGLDGDQSGLFYKFLDVIREKKPRYFILENVASMKDEDRDEISKKLGCQPIMLTSLHWTGQNRERYYWCNFPVQTALPAPVDPRDVIDKTDIPTEPMSKYIKLSELYSAYKPTGKMTNPKNYAKDSVDWDFVSWSRSTRYKTFEDKKSFDEWRKKNPDIEFKTMAWTKDPFNHPDKISYVEQRIKINIQANTLVTGKHCARMSAKNFVRHKGKMRPINTKEALRLQGLPDDYLDGLSDSAIYSAVGDSFTLGPIVHILKSLKEVTDND